MEGGGMGEARKPVGMDSKGSERDSGAIEVVDPFAVQEEPIVSQAEKRGLTREQAIAYGRRLAEDECAKLKVRRTDFTDQDCRERVARAERYAAWEYDGRLAGTIGRRI